MRSKEEANDYRYFPCPDLLPVHVSKEFINNLRKDLPELPENKKNRYKEQYGLSEYDANGLTENFLFAKFFEDSMQLFDKPKLLANWILGDVSSKLNQANITLKDSLISPKHLVELLKRIEDKTISNKIAKEVFEEIFEGKGNADSIIKEKGLSQISDAKFLEELVSKVISDNPNMV